MLLGDLATLRTQEAELCRLANLLSVPGKRHYTSPPPPPSLLIPPPPLPPSLLPTQTTTTTIDTITPTTTTTTTIITTTPFPHAALESVLAVLLLHGMRLSGKLPKVFPQVKEWKSPWW